MADMIQSRRAFTVIELLVVISIIAMLVSVVLVSLNGARQKGTIAASIEFADYNYQKLGVNEIISMSFDQGPNPSIPLDSTGNFTANGSIYYSTSTPFSSGYSFDNSGLCSGCSVGYVSMSLSNGNGSIPLADGSGVTVSVWINTLGSLPGTKAGTQTEYVFSDGSNSKSLSPLGYDYIDFDSTGSLHCLIGKKLSGGSVITYAMPLDSNWHNITCIYDANSSSDLLYVDGKSAVSPVSMSPIALTAQDSPIAVGSGFSGSSPASPFYGLIDNFQIFSGSLTAMQVKEIYAEGLPARRLAER